MGKIGCASGTPSIGDAVLFPGDQIELKLQPGEYAVGVMALGYGTDRRISRLRAALSGRAGWITVRAAGTIGVDFAVIGVCDDPDFLQAL